MSRLNDPRLEGVAAFLTVMDRLRGDGGCPWDRAQTSKSLRPFLLEETYEVLEALDSGDNAHLCEELGDLLFQVVFHARIKQEQGHFDFGSVAKGIAAKLTRRHPHVFSDAGPRSSDEVVASWELQKKAERGPEASALDGVPTALPALAQSQRIQDKAARTGFDWRDPRGPLAKIHEETRELSVELERQDRARCGEELGDLLFSAVALARHLDLNAEDLLRETNARFSARFRDMEAVASDGPELGERSAEQLEELWRLAKQRESAQRDPRSS
jgi:tetrapyrrole methylase family protein / MazG family protein